MTRATAEHIRPLTVAEGECKLHILLIGVTTSSAWPEWVYDRSNNLYWRSSLTPPWSTAESPDPYRHEGARWEAVINMREQMDAAARWQEITDTHELALLAAMEKAVAAYLGRRRRPRARLAANVVNIADARARLKQKVGKPWNTNRS